MHKNIQTRIFWTFSNLANNNILLMSFKRTFDIYMVEIHWKLSFIDLTPVNHIKDKKCYWNFITQTLDSVFWGHFHTLMVNFNNKSKSKP